jgi:hypothetical protein
MPKVDLSTTDLQGAAGRGGITVDERGTEKALGFWPKPYHDASATSWVGRAGAVFREAVRVAQRRHEQNRHIIESNIRNQPPKVGEPNVRQSVARGEQRKLAELHHQVGQVADEVFLARAKLTPFDYNNDIAPALRRQELRALLRSMPNDEERMKAMHNVEFRRAALEQPGLASGIPDSTLAELRREQVAARFPEEVANIEEAEQAIEIARGVLKTTELAVSNELVQSGTTVAEPAAPSESKPWA